MEDLELILELGLISEENIENLSWWRDRGSWHRKGCRYIFIEFLMLIVECFIFDFCGSTLCFYFLFIILILCVKFIFASDICDSLKENCTLRKSKNLRFFLFLGDSNIFDLVEDYFTKNSEISFCSLFPIVFLFFLDYLRGFLILLFIFLLYWICWKFYILALIFSLILLNLFSLFIFYVMYTCKACWDFIFYPFAEKTFQYVEIEKSYLQEIDPGFDQRRGERFYFRFFSTSMERFMDWYLVERNIIRFANFALYTVYCGVPGVGFVLLLEICFSFDLWVKKNLWGLVFTDNVVESYFASLFYLDAIIFYGVIIGSFLFLLYRIISYFLPIFKIVTYDPLFLSSLVCKVNNLCVYLENSFIFKLSFIFVNFIEKWCGES